MKSKLILAISFICGSFGLDAQTDNSFSFFDDTPARINLPTSDFAPPWTVEAWFYKNAPVSGSASYLLSSASGNGTVGIHLEQRDHTGKIGVSVSNTVHHDFNYTLNSEVWQHVAVVCDGSDMRLYINGVATGDNINTTIDAPMGFIGHNNNNFRMNGDLDEMRIWNKALSATQILAMMHQEIEQNGTAVQGSDDSNTISGIDWADLQAYYKFNESSGSDILDASSNGNDATAIGNTNANWKNSSVPFIWKGSGSNNWSSLSNWNDRGRGNVPGSNDDIMVLNGTNNGLQIAASRSMRNVSIWDGASIDIQAGGSLNASGKVKMNGSNAIVLHSDATNTGNLVDAGNLSYLNGGSVKVERYMDSGSSIYLEGYHYISSPINNHAIFDDMGDLYAFRETDLNWLHHSGPNGFSTFTNGQGYAILYSSDITKEFSGEVNTGDISIDLTYTDHSGNPYEHYSLIGNPYPSSINLNTFISENSSVLGNTVSFWNGVDYATYNTGLGTGTGGSYNIIPDGNIAVGQAFFVEAQQAGTVTFTNAMRNTDSDIFYKKTQPAYLRLNLISEEFSNQLLIAEHAEASIEKDPLDSKKLFGNTKLSFYSIIDKEAFAIQSVPDIETEFPLGVRADEMMDVRFSIGELVKLNGQIYLEDRQEGRIIHLNEEDYNTRIKPGENEERFVLRIGNPALGLKVWLDQNGLIHTNDNELKALSLISMDGKLVSEIDQMKLRNYTNIASGVYFLHMQNQKRNFYHKLIISQRQQ